MLTTGTNLMGGALDMYTVTCSSGDLTLVPDLGELEGGLKAFGAIQMIGTIDTTNATTKRTVRVAFTKNTGFSSATAEDTSAEVCAKLKALIEEQGALLGTVTVAAFVF